MLSTLSILCSFIALSLASISDLKSREVSDSIWIFYGLTSLSLTLIKFIFDSSNLWLSIASIILTSVFSLLLFEVGFFGGADFKGMVCLSLALPLYPKTLASILGFIHPFFPLATLYNAFLFSCIYPIYILARNINYYFRVDKRIFNELNHESNWKKFLALISGYKEEFFKVEKLHYLYPMEEILWINNKALRKLRLVFDAGLNREELLENLKRASSKGIVLKTIWVSPGLPMILFITLSFLVNLVFGDVLTWLIKLLLF
ncbi:MAG: A24 family peptidase C-terminal domain-containing protein [Candidatus Bathyarchaeia archaeon]|nr:prepilin peptidase [Candidatus Bathyarchaeota archaeon]